MHEKETKLSQYRNRLPEFLRRLFSKKQETRTPKIGLALSCGGAKSLAHVGVLEVLAKNNIPIHAISGSSMGAYIGALWATGHSVEQMIELAEQMQDPTTLKKLADPVIPPIKGVFYGHKVKTHLSHSIGNVNFEDLDRKLLVIAANLDTYERVVFRQGSVLDAVHASCAMPGIVVPVEVNGMRCTDGGVVDPVPVGALHKFTDVDYVIAVSTIPTIAEIDTHISATETAKEDKEEIAPWWRSTLYKLGSKINPAAPGNMIDNLRRSLRASQIRMAHDSCLRADLTIHPVSKGAQWHEYDRFEHFIALGREKATSALPLIREILEPIPVKTDDSSTQEPMVGERVA
ncbi:Predicted acylesterase/phospholipase RssA, contains patatin domain [Rubritalea squalenifaciens DSM 18772]|uniref:Predicted acylesterase/phospholipase RssA, contains patatin domain n=1 Tax=Rubritalea squalenifaciens DSM 18772 TaxID=1123071 RepID=A0A1M6HIM9_9BACT|nr:patatin-like phospholipase family protein [Rubritalea squalenifaciens]SHJ22038.1 Predicted acylesterase/phospholipase RssA, contains patatin domain [Rubritalea squalenifaciens DSM 18772]